MTEKDILNAIKKSADKTDIPESLKPENMEQKLRSLNPETDAKPDRRRFPIFRLGAAAAVFALAFFAVSQSGFLKTSIEKEPAAEKTSEKTAPAAYATQEAETVSPENAAATADSHNSDSSAKAAASTDTTGETDSISTADTESIDFNNASADTASIETESEADTSSLTSITASAAPLQEKLTPAGDYKSVYQALHDAFGNDLVFNDMGIYEEGVMVESAKADAAGMSVNTTAADSAYGQETGASYSSTNVQVQGVDEGDLVKTDGKYIYVLRRTGSLVIVDPSGKSRMNIAARIDLDLNQTPREMYVDGNFLSVIATEYYSVIESSKSDVISSRSGTRTLLHTYDISDPEKPVLKGTVTQDGSYSQSRKQGNYIYLFSQFTPEIQNTFEESAIIPLTSSGYVSASDIYLPEHLSCTSYLVVSSIDLNDPSETFNQKAVVSVPSTFYVSQESIYIANEIWNGPNTRTDLLKLSYRDGVIVGSAAGSLEGYLNDSFSLDEYDGYLRAVTTSYDDNYTESNGLYILDEDLKLTGAIRDLAPDETIRSARFLGNTGYFVTFRQTDPLFSVDLSDPASPRVLGDLKVTGFSSYLHFYSETLLLGLGYEADPNTGVQTGLKLSMFDISDPSDVKEVHRLVLNGITWCEALENYKSILMDPGKNLFGFTCDNRYLLFSYNEETGFEKEFIYDFYNDIIAEGLDTRQNEITGESSAAASDTDMYTIGAVSPEIGSFSVSRNDSADTRGLYIDDILYLVRPESVSAFNMADNYLSEGRLTLK